MPERVMRVLAGRLTDAGAVADALTAADAKTDLGRWYLDPSLVDDDAGETYVLSKMWGLHTEPALAALTEAFPEAGVGFRRADTGEE